MTSYPWWGGIPVLKSVNYVQSFLSLQRATIDRELDKTNTKPLECCIESVRRRTNTNSLKSEMKRRGGLLGYDAALMQTAW